ncbi:hypothetical protein OF83DRAFT_1089405, partial [Amylostereum chailletii]
HERGLGLWRTGSFSEEEQKFRMSEENWGEAAAGYFNAVSSLPKAKWARIMSAAHVYSSTARARRGLPVCPSAGPSRKGKAREIQWRLVMHRLDSAAAGVGVTIQACYGIYDSYDGYNGYDGYDKYDR